MRNPLIIAACLAAAVASATPALAQVRPPAPADQPVAGQQSVPVKEVVLYTSGVGYFEHFGTVKGDAFTELHFKTGQINDILKSLLLEDLDHGKVASVTYGSQEPLAHTLKSFEVDLSSAPPLNELLAQLRGANVTATLAGGPVAGTILSLEKKQKAAGDKQVVEVWVMNLLLPGGSIRRMELDDMTEIRLDDPKLQQELVKALLAVAAARDQESKPVAIRFTGQGERRVRIGYVVEAPVWKASYRLVLTEEAKNEAPAEPDADKKPADPAKDVGGKLQGWAIVENQTNSDWENVQLSLVSGRPISFVEDLYQPLFVTRPVVEPELYASLRPQKYEEGLESTIGNRRAALMEEQKDLADAPAAAAPMPYAAKGMRAKRGMAMDKAGEAFGASGGGANGVIDPTASVSSLASGASVGEFFQYTVGDVSLPRQKSAMIPIITDTVRATRLSIYNASVLPDHPLLGARLTNTTGKLLPQGPITVLDGGAYAGDATILDLPASQNRLLSYGIDQSVLVHNKESSENSSIVTAKIVKGVLVVTHKQVFIQQYNAENKAKTERTLLIEHPKHRDWTLVQPKHPMESTDTLYRFEETLPADKSQTFVVQEEFVNNQGIAILPMNTSQLESYFRTGPIPDDVKKALQEAARMKYAMAETDRQITQQQQSIDEITQEQNRIRENMKAVNPSSDYYKRLEQELNDQETELQKIKANIKELRLKSHQQRKDLESYLEKLSVG